MPSEYRGMIVKFRRGSVFIRTFFILALLSVIVVITFYSFASSLYAQRLRENVTASNQNLLTQASNTVDLQLSQVVATTSHFMRNMDVIESTTAPNKDNYPRNRSVVEQISALVQGDNVIRNFYYYIPYNDMVYASKGDLVNYIPFAEFEHQPLVEDYIEGVQEWKLFDYRSIAAYVRIVDGDIYIYQPFPVKNKLFGLAVIELDSQELLNALAGAPAETGQAIYAYDNALHPVFAGVMPYPNVDFSQDASYTGVVETHDTLYYIQPAERTGWRYVYAVPAGLQMHDRLHIVSLLPFLLFFLAVSLLFSLYITRSIYKPIGNLMTAITTATAGREGPARAANEFDYLQMAYSDVVGRAEALSGLLENVTPAILETMFLNIIHQTCPQEDYIERTLQSIGEPIVREAPYAVLVGELQGAGGTPPTEMERQLYGISLDQAILASLPKATRHFCFADRDGAILAVLCLDAEKSPAELRGDLARLYAAIGQRVGQLPFEVALGEGSACSDLRELHLSYLEAQRMLRTRLYYGSGGTAPSPDSEQADERQREEYLAQRAGYLIKLATEGNRDAAEEFAAHTLEQLAKEGDKPTICAALIRFGEIVLENMQTLHVDDEALAALRETTREAGERYAGRADKLAHHLALLCTQATLLLEQTSGKQSFRYIRSAREYIMDNYGDSGLSLQTVSEHTGISPAYLSKLFNEHLHKGFNSYVGWVRVEKAKELLHASGLSVAAVGFQTGFNSTQSFIRVFKRYTGMTPGQFREHRLPPEKEGTEGGTETNTD